MEVCFHLFFVHSRRLLPPLPHSFASLNLPGICDTCIVFVISENKSIGSVHVMPLFTTQIPSKFIIIALRLYNSATLKALVSRLFHLSNAMSSTVTLAV